MTDNHRSTYSANGRPVRLILDTDMGNDIDDALALAMIHALQTRGECRLLGVAISKDNPHSPVYVDILNTFYGRGDIPIGVVRNGATPDDGNYAGQVAELKDSGQPRYARTHASSDYPEAVGMLRLLLVDQPDKSVVLVMIGFSTNLARLLESPPDDVSELPGGELFRRKVRQVIMMAAKFDEQTKANPTPESREYNILKDIPSAKRFVADCPSPITFSGLEVGSALMYPGAETEHRFDWTPHHPVLDAYRRYRPMPYDRPTWDLTAVLAAVRPDHDYFGLSERGAASVEDDGIVRFAPDPDGLHRHLTLADVQRERVTQTMIELVTQPVIRSRVHIKAGLPASSKRPGEPVAGAGGTLAASRTESR